MADIVDKTTRSRMMANIRSRNTTGEMAIRKGLFGMGFRYRLHPSALPGRPDFILPKYNAAVFIHGCFWHAHGCALFKLPSTRRDWWTKKFQGNRLRDARNIHDLLDMGWRVLIVWECAFRQTGKGGAECLAETIAAAAKWLLGNASTGVIDAEGLSCHAIEEKDW